MPARARALVLPCLIVHGGYSMAPRLAAGNGFDVVGRASPGAKMGRGPRRVVVAGLAINPVGVYRRALGPTCRSCCTGQIHFLDRL
jgi:hypothetical protein